MAAWIAIFHYETLRLHYLSPLAGRLPHQLRFASQNGWGELPKLKFLYPPAGWIMFFHVDQRYGMAEVYGLRDSRPTLLDPHDIFRTRFVLYDNIRRNALIAALSPARAQPFCRFLARQFPDYPEFAVVYAQYPDVVNQPNNVQRQLAYQCPQGK